MTALADSLSTAGPTGSEPKTRAPAQPARMFRVAAVFLCVLAMLALLAPAPAQANPKYGSIVIDARTGKVISSRYADKKLHPASLTKMMTLYMTFEALEQGRLKRNQMLKVSKHASTMVPSKLGLKPGDKIMVEHAIYALVTKSANDVAVVLAEALAGSERNFARYMTARARQLGMSRTTFINASGLHDRNQVSSPRDMAKLSRALMMHYPQYYHYFSTLEFTYRGKTYGNHNRLMKDYRGMDGLKTGYVAASGFNLAASAVRDGTRLIGVVFGGRTSRSRNAHMATLLNRAFTKVGKSNLLMAQAKIPVPARKPGGASRDPVLASAAAANPNTTTATTSASAAGVKLASFAGLGVGYSADDLAGIENRIAEILGEGDQNPDEVTRIETGMLAIAALTGKNQNMPGVGSVNVADIRASQPTQQESWGIQVGAFNNLKRTRLAMEQAAGQLPGEIVARMSPAILEKNLRGGKKLYRARFMGLDRHAAARACTILSDCMPVAPGTK